MKKQVILFAWVILLSLGISHTLQAQLRRYKIPIYDDFDDVGIGGRKTTIAYKPTITYTPYVTPPKTKSFINSWGGFSTINIPVFLIPKIG